MLFLPANLGNVHVNFTVRLLVSHGLLYVLETFYLLPFLALHSC